MWFSHRHRSQHYRLLHKYWLYISSLCVFGCLELAQYMFYWLSLELQRPYTLFTACHRTSIISYDRYKQQLLSNTQWKQDHINCWVLSTAFCEYQTTQIAMFLADEWIKQYNHTFIICWYILSISYLKANTIWNEQQTIAIPLTPTMHHCSMHHSPSKLTLESLRWIVIQINCRCLRKVVFSM